MRHKKEVNYDKLFVDPENVPNERSELRVIKDENVVNINNTKMIMNKENYDNNKAIVNYNNRQVYNEFLQLKRVVRKRVLFISWYDEKDVHRRNEYVECLEKNISNPYIDEIYLLIENESEMYINNDTRKIRQIVTNVKRPTYRNFFLVATKYLSSDDLIIIANSDIYFDSSLRFIDYIDFNNTVCFLTRYDNNNNNFVHRNSAFSQDVWIMKNGNFVQHSDYTLGYGGCDNKIAYEYFISGYNVINPSYTIKTYHVHSIRKQNMNERYKKPYKSIEPISLNLENKKKILHIGLNMKYQKSLCNALAKDMLYRPIDWREKLKTIDVYKLREEIINECKYDCPDYIFMQIQTADIIDEKTIQEIVKLNNEIIIINWSGDVREPLPRWFINIAESAKHNVVTSFSNYDDVNTMFKQGYKSVLMQMGYEKYIYNPSKDVTINGNDIVFIGNHYGHKKFPLSKHRCDVVKWLCKIYGDKVSVYGNKKWLEVITKKNYISSVAPEQEYSIFRTSKITLCMNHFNRKFYTSGRLFRCLGSMGFCLTEYYEGIEEEFTNHEHLVWFKNNDEMCDMIDYYLAHNDERNNIARNGELLVNNNLNWENRIKGLFNVINKGV